MNFPVYKTLSIRDQFFADLIVELIQAVKNQGEGDFGPLEGINSLDEVMKLANENAAEQA